MDKLIRSRQIIFILLILFLSIWIKSVNLSGRYTFDWDQADDATKVMGMIWDKKPLLIGPRVASENGFFAGPYHYYFLLPFYLATGGNPIAGAYAAIAVGTISALATYFVGKSLYGEKVGIVGALISASSISIASWNAMFIAPISIVGYYFCTRLLYSNKMFLKASLFAGLASTIHLVPATLVGYLTVSQFLSTDRASLKQYLKGAFLLLLFFLPLVIFDLRHEFINFHKLLNFISGNSTSATYPSWLYLRTFWRSIEIDANLGYYFEKFLIITSFVYVLLKQKDGRSKMLLLSWVLLPLLFLSRYHGNIPEYYYGMVTALAPLFIAKLFVDLTPLWLVSTLVIVLFYYQIQAAKGSSAQITLRNKIDVVRYIVNQKEFPVFNVSYDLPLGYDTGYQYLFKYFKHEPYSGPEGHLFSISLVFNGNEKFVYNSGIVGVIKR